MATAFATIVAASGAFAQVAAPPDSVSPVAQTAAAPALAQAGDGPDTTTVPVRRQLGPTDRDRTRIEFGAALVDDPFDFLGTVGYHRFVRIGGPFEQWAHVELAGGARDELREGALSVAYLLRPLRAIRRGSRIQPILEFGPAGHLVVQLADVDGFGETAFHARAYGKMHAYAGLDFLMGSGWGLVVRGRLTVPDHRPFDYAQIALFLR